MNICTHTNISCSGLSRRYSDRLRAGRSAGRIPVEKRFSAPVQTYPGTHPDSCTVGTGSFLMGGGLKSGLGVKLTPHILLVPWSRKAACTEPQCLYSRAIPLLPLWALRPVQSLSACTVQLYLYSPYWPYGLYRTSVLVQ